MPWQQKNLRVPPSKPALRGSRDGATLIVTPASLLSHWIEQIETHVDRRVDLKVFVHYGRNKAHVKSELEEQDIVLTTYGTMSADFASLKHSALFSTRWLRICLDEGHMIKNHRTVQARAADHLKAKRRWIISGRI